MKFNLFLFDLDDTLLDFRESEKLSFMRTMKSFGDVKNIDDVFADYQLINREQWKLFEEGKTTKDLLKVERFRKTFSKHSLDINPDLASSRYLDTLPQTVVLVDHAVEVCEALSAHGEIGIVTNGIHHVQTSRIKNSPLDRYISFVAVSEECGFAKPDVRFFDYSIKKARSFSKSSTVIIGDRLEADIQGALNFGIHGCWFNPEKKANMSAITPHSEVHHLSLLREKLGF